MENYFLPCTKLKPHSALVLVRRALTLADRSQEKLLKSTDCQV